MRKLVLIDPPWVGLELVAEKVKGRTVLHFAGGQHRYVFEPLATPPAAPK